MEHVTLTPSFECLRSGCMAGVDMGGRLLSQTETIHPGILHPLQEAPICILIVYILDNQDNSHWIMAEWAAAYGASLAELFRPTVSSSVTPTMVTATDPVQTILSIEPNGADRHRHPVLYATGINGLPPQAYTPAQRQTLYQRPRGTESANLLSLDVDHRAEFHGHSEEKIHKITRDRHEIHWDQIMKDPKALVMAIVKTVGKTVGYVIWNYQDLVEQFRSWDGSLMGLFHHTQLIWRSLVSVGMTLVLLELGPFLEALMRLTMEILDILWASVGMIGRGIEELWWFSQVLWADASALVERLTDM